MVKAKKYKKLTNAEKKFNKEFKEKMVAEGILPPPKPKLNRKKFISESLKEFQELNNFDRTFYLHESIRWMLAGFDSKYQKASPEQVGVAKVLKIAYEISKFHQEKSDKNETKYKPYDLYRDIIVPILEL